MTITAIAEQQKDKNRVNVFIDGVYTLSLTLDQILTEKIKPGLQLESKDVERLKKLSSDGKLKQRMYEWLGLRPHSQKELRDYLHRKQVGPEQIELWVKEAQDYHLQDDTSFARWWVEQRRHKNRSESFIRQELRQKGVDQATIADVLTDNETKDNDALKQLIAKKRTQTRYADTKKLTDYLLRQGYRYSDIVDALAE